MKRLEASWQSSRRVVQPVAACLDPLRESAPVVGAPAPLEPGPVRSKPSPSGATGRCVASRRAWPPGRPRGGHPPSGPRRTAAPGRNRARAASRATSRRQERARWRRRAPQARPDRRARRHRRPPREVRSLGRRPLDTPRPSPPPAGCRSPRTARERQACRRAGRGRRVPPRQDSRASAPDQTRRATWPSPRAGSHRPARQPVRTRSTRRPRSSRSRRKARSSTSWFLCFQRLAG